MRLINIVERVRLRQFRKVAAPAYTPQFRINSYGALIDATDVSNLDWQQDITGTRVGFSFTGGSFSNLTSFNWTKGPTIPLDMPTADYTAVFNSQRYISSGVLAYRIPNLPNGTYKVIIYTGIDGNFSSSFDVNINNVNKGNYDPFFLFGGSTSGILEFEGIEITDGIITVSLDNSNTYAYLCGLELLLLSSAPVNVEIPILLLLELTYTAEEVTVDTHTTVLIDALELTYTAEEITVDITTTGGFQAEYTAILNEATLSGYTLPTETEQIVQDGMIVNLKANGIWDSLDALWWFKGDGDANFKKINWLDPTNTKAVLSNGNAVTFDSSGYQSQNANNRLDLRPIWSNLTIQDASVIGEVVRPLTVGNGISDDGDYTLWFKNQNTSQYINGNGGQSVSANFTGTGVFGLQAVQIGTGLTSNIEAYKNGVLLNTRTNLTLAATIKENLLRSNFGSGAYSDVKLGFLAYGSSISQADFYSAITVSVDVVISTLELTYTAEVLTVDTHTTVLIDTLELTYTAEVLTVDLGDPIVSISNLELYVNNTSIVASATTENDPINTWSDISGNGLDATQSGAARPTLHISSGSTRQTSFSGSQWLNLGQPSALNFDPTINNFSIVIKIGEVAGTTGYIISKGGASASLRKWGLFFDVDAFGSFINGNNSYPLGGNHTLAANDLIIYTVSANTVETLYVNSSTIGAETNFPASVVETADVNIGGRSNGGFLYNGDLALIAVYSKVLTPSEITDIRDTYMEN